MLSIHRGWDGMVEARLERDDCQVYVYKNGVSGRVRSSKKKRKETFRFTAPGYVLKLYTRKGE